MSPEPLEEIPPIGAVLLVISDRSKYEGNFVHVHKQHRSGRVGVMTAGGTKLHYCITALAYPSRGYFRRFPEEKAPFVKCCKRRDRLNGYHRAPGHDYVEDDGEDRDLTDSGDSIPPEQRARRGDRDASMRDVNTMDHLAGELRNVQVLLERLQIEVTQNFAAVSRHSTSVEQRLSHLEGIPRQHNGPHHNVPDIVPSDHAHMD